MAKKVYGDRWEIVEPLGEGGQAHTFRARDLNDDSEGWALKRLKNTNRLGRFEQEVQALKELNSARIPAIADWSFEDQPYLVTKYIGPNLQDVMASLEALGRLSAPAFAGIPPSDR